MRSSRFDFVHVAGVCGRAAVTAALCAGLVGEPLLAASPKPVPAANAGQMQGRDRVLHALNRLTFGPKPGDMAAVQAMGLEKWFELQLNPGKIDDAALDARLAAYPAASMPMDKLEAKYPNPQALRQMMDGKVALPSDPTQRALVEDQIAFYSMQKAQKEKAAAPQVGAGAGSALASDGSMVAANGGDAAAPAMAKGKRRQQMQAGMDALAAADVPDGMEKPLPANAISGDAMDSGEGLGKMSVAELQPVFNQAPDQRFQGLMAMAPKDLVRLRNSLGPAQVERLTAGMTPEQKETLVALPGSIRMVALESMESRLDRDIYSDRQLEAVMTDFWLNHFNVYVRKSQLAPYQLASYERETIRPNALGKFEDLLVATAESPAMLVYLDNFRSVGPDSLAATRLKRFQEMRPNGKIAKASAGLNENYGRELMELHTLGVGGGYTQADVTMVSKVFTGWTLEKPYQGGGFVFEEKRHEPGPKTVLGKTINEGGEKEGLEVLHMLATSPATAKFICTKLAVRFVSDNPPSSLVDKMSASFLKSDGDIKTVLRTMFHAPEFWSADVYRAKVKTPLEFVVSAVRASDLQVANPQALVKSLEILGMPLYGMQTPNGYSWKKDDWVSTGALVNRMNFSLVMSDDRMPGTRTEWSELLGEGSAGVQPAEYVAGGDAAAKERKLEGILLGGPASEKTRATVLAQSGDGNIAAQASAQFDLGGGGGGGAKKDYAGRGLGRVQKDQAGPGDAQAALMAGLLLGSPEFQKR